MGTPSNLAEYTRGKTPAKKWNGYGLLLKFEEQTWKYEGGMRIPEKSGKLRKIAGLSTLRNFAESGGSKLSRPLIGPKLDQ